MRGWWEIEPSVCKTLVAIPNTALPQKNSIKRFINWLGLQLSFQHACLAGTKL